MYVYMHIIGLVLLYSLEAHFQHKFKMAIFSSVNDMCTVQYNVCGCMLKIVRLRASVRITHTNTFTQK